MLLYVSSILVYGDLRLNPHLCSMVVIFCLPSMNTSLNCMLWVALFSLYSEEFVVSLCRNYCIFISAFLLVCVGNELKPDPEDLAVKPCLRSLAALRHAKWFQVCITLCLLCIFSILLFCFSSFVAFFSNFFFLTPVNQNLRCRCMFIRDNNESMQRPK